MQPDDLDATLVVWGNIFDAELRSHLGDLTDDSSICGFAVELPSDFSNDGVISRVAKRRMKLPMRSQVPALDDWEYVPNGKTFGHSCDGLTDLYAKYSSELGDETFYTTFGNRLYATILDTMKQCNADGQFASIDVKLLTLSDDEHPILREAAMVLNDGPNQKLALAFAEF